MVVVGRVDHPAAWTAPTAVTSPSAGAGSAAWAGPGCPSQAWPVNRTLSCACYVLFTTVNHTLCMCVLCGMCSVLFFLKCHIILCYLVWSITPYACACACYVLFSVVDHNPCMCVLCVIYYSQSHLMCYVLYNIVRFRGFKMAPTIGI